jgi:tungstate transport system ATP-binding protein
MMSPVIEVEDLLVAYQGRAVLEVGHLAVQPREVLTIVGPNGAGKSTLLRVLALLEVPTRGTVRFAGIPVQYQHTHLLPLRRRMAVVFQASLLCDTTVYGNVALGLRYRGAASAEIEQRVWPWLRRLGIGHLAFRSAKTLSGGEAQRTSLARAFVVGPEVLFLDEPFEALDAPTREDLLLELESVLRESGVTTVFVTHDRSEALRLGDRVALLLGGRLVQVDTPDRVFSYPASEEAARFVGAGTIVSGVVRASGGGLCVVAVEGGELQVESEATLGEHVLVCLRPEDVVLSRPESPPMATSMRNALLGKIRRIVPLETHIRVHVDVGFEVRALITKPSLDELHLREEQEVRVSFKATATHVIRKFG